jgi:hypothetical protein
VSELRENGTVKGSTDKYFPLVQNPDNSVVEENLFLQMDQEQLAKYFPEEEAGWHGYVQWEKYPGM